DDWAWRLTISGGTTLGRPRMPRLGSGGPAGWHGNCAPTRGGNQLGTGLAEPKHQETLLGCLPWRQLRCAIDVEVKNREVHQPLVSLYRWWARRPHSLIG